MGSQSNGSRKWSVMYDKAGNVIPPEDVDAFRVLATGPDCTYRKVARSTVTNAVNPAQSFDVSTIWLGSDISGGVGAPSIFETMVFAEGEPLTCQRYSTLTQAEFGHCETVALMAKTFDDATVTDIE